MKKYIIAIAAILLMLSACSAEDPNLPSHSKSSADYTSELDMNSPEGLAKFTSELYMGMVNGDIGPTTGYEKLLDVIIPESVNAMNENKTQFINEIDQTQEYLKDNNDKVTGYKYAETVYEGDDKASIMRIQIQQSGKKYYFKQDFKMIDGVWKIAGDNIEDPFTVK